MRKIYLMNSKTRIKSKKRKIKIIKKVSNKIWKLKKKRINKKMIYLMNLKIPAQNKIIKNTNKMKIKKRIYLMNMKKLKKILIVKL